MLGSQKHFVLSEGDQTKIGYLVTSFAKSQPNLLKYSEVIALMLDRCIFNTKFTLVDFQPLFEASLLVKSNKVVSQKTEVQGERVINIDQLIFLFNQAAKLLYKPDPNFLQRFYLNLLSQKMESDGGEINRARVMIIDDLSKKLIVEETIKHLCLYAQEIRHIFIAYTTQNYWSLKRKKRLLLSFREILLQNKRWSYLSLVLFLKQSETCPHLATVQHVEDIMRFVIPNINTKQQQFYSKHILSEAYHKDFDGQDGNLHQGDPGIMLFELQLIIIRLAWDTYPKQMEKKDLGIIIERYLKYLYLRQNNHLNSQQLPPINRKMISKMKDYYRVINNEMPNENEKSSAPEEKGSHFERLARKMEKQIMNAPPVGVDFPEMLKTLERQLPKLPLPPKVQPEYVGKYDKNFAITIGQQPPPEPVEKDEKAKVQKKDGGKKDQIPPREFKWADVPTGKLSTEDYLKGIEQKLNYQVRPLGDISRGTISKQGYPILIGQTLFPPQLPKNVVPYLEAANNAIVDRNFMLAIENLQAGANAWKKTSVEFDSMAQLYFQYSKGNIYLAASKIDYAFNIFFNCRKFADTSKLPFTNPDRSLPFFGLGEVFYEMEQYQLAARSFLKARQIREHVLGLEHVQTASVFNNLGACYYLLGRAQQALGYIEIAQVVLDTELGPHHERTMTSRSNLKKISHGSFENKPQFRKFWQVFEADRFEKKKKKKKDDGDKKGKK